MRNQHNHSHPLRDFAFGLIPLLFVGWFLCATFLSNDAFIGETWDWNIPHMREQVRDILGRSIFIWDDSAIGGRYSFIRAETPYWILLGMLSLIPSSSSITGLAIVCIFFFAWLSFYLFAARYERNSLIQSTAIASLFAFNPYTYSRLVAGHLTVIVSYGFLPVLFWAAQKYIAAETKIKIIAYALLIAFIFLFLSVHTSNFLLGSAVILFVFVSSLRKRIIVKTTLVTLLVILFNFHWLAPLVYLFVFKLGAIEFHFGETILDEAARRFEYWRTISQPLYKIFTNTIEFGLNTEFVYPFPEALRFLLVLSSITLWGAGLMSYFTNKTKEVFHTWSVAFLLIGLGVVAGSKSIIGFCVYLLLQKMAPGFFSALSNPLRLYQFPLIFLLFSISMFFNPRKGNSTRIITLAVFFAAAVWLYPWVVSPLALVKPAESQPLGLRRNKVASEAGQLYESLKSEQTDDRVMFLPPAQNSWPGETDLPFSWETNVYQKSVILQHAQEPLSETIFPYLYGQRYSPHLAKILGLANVRMLIYPQYPYFESYAQYIPNTVNYSSIFEDHINVLEGLTERESIGRVQFFTNDYMLPKIYAARQTTFIAGDKTALTDAASFPQYELRNAIFFSEQNINPDRLASEAQQVVVKATQSWLQQANLGEDQYFVPVRFLPNAFFYPIIQWKESRQLKQVSGVPQAETDVHFIFLGKRMFEFIQLSQDQKTGLEYGEGVLARYKSLLRSIVAASASLDPSAIETHKKYEDIIVLLEKHRTKLQELWRDKRDNIRVPALQDTVGEIESARAIIRSRLWASNDPQEQKFFLQVPQDGMYAILASRDDMTSAKNFSVDNNVLWKNTPSIDGKWNDYGQIFLSKGTKRVLVSMEPAANLFQGFENVTQVNNSVVMNGRVDPIQYCGRATNLTPLSEYQVSVRYQSLGDPMRLTIEQENDEQVRGVKKHAIDEYLNSGFRWDVFRYNFYTNIDSSNVNICFTLPADQNETSQYSVADIMVTGVRHPVLLAKKIVPNPVLSVPQIAFYKLNPTKYYVRVTGANKYFYLIFSESFDTAWKAYIRPRSKAFTDRELRANYFDGAIKEMRSDKTFLDRNLFENTQSTPIAETNHFRINAYANAWKVDGDGDFDIIIEFVPQRLYVVALAVSAISIMGSVVLFGILRRRKKI